MAGYACCVVLNIFGERNGINHGRKRSKFCMLCCVEHVWGRITYVWQAIRKEVVRPNPISVSPRCVRAEEKKLLSNITGTKNSLKQI